MASWRGTSQWGDSRIPVCLTNPPRSLHEAIVPKFLQCKRQYLYSGPQCTKGPGERGRAPKKEEEGGCRGHVCRPIRGSQCSGSRCQLSPQACRAQEPGQVLGAAGLIVLRLVRGRTCREKAGTPCMAQHPRLSTPVIIWGRPPAPAGRAAAVLAPQDSEHPAQGQAGSPWCPVAESTRLHSGDEGRTRTARCALGPRSAPWRRWESSAQWVGAGGPRDFPGLTFVRQPRGCWWWHFL